jgi:hypothetical protein
MTDFTHFDEESREIKDRCGRKTKIRKRRERVERGVSKLCVCVV